MIDKIKELREQYEMEIKRLVLENKKLKEDLKNLKDPKEETKIQITK